MFKIAVVTFPGMNREVEAKRAIERNGMQGFIFRWNDNPEKLSQFDGFMFPGGFSYEDRGRSGVIAAQDPVIDYIKKEAQKGKPVLGVCNGAQVLIETGMVPGVNGTHLQGALGWNERIKNDQILGTGFYNTWVYLKNTAPFGRCAFNNFKELLYIPIAHGEGRFIFEDDLLQKLEENQQIVLRYCDAKGEITDEFPINPNGSMRNIAGICNEEGNVLALMPHPETFPNGDALFISLRKYLEQKVPLEKGDLGGLKPQRDENSQISFSGEPPPTPLVKGGKVSVLPKEHYDLEFYVKLIITDNTEKTLERTLQTKIAPAIKLKRSVFWGIQSQERDLKKLAADIIDSGELFNLNKETVKIKIGKDFYTFTKGQGLKKLAGSFYREPYFIFEQKDFVGMAKTKSLQHFLGENRLKEAHRAEVYEIESSQEEIIQQVLDSFILYNPYSMNLKRRSK